MASSNASLLGSRRLCRFGLLSPFAGLDLPLALRRPTGYYAARGTSSTSKLLSIAPCLGHRWRVSSGCRVQLTLQFSALLPLSRRSRPSALSTRPRSHRRLRSWNCGTETHLLECHSGKEKLDRLCGRRPLLAILGFPDYYRILFTYGTLDPGSFIKLEPGAEQFSSYMALILRRRPWKMALYLVCIFPILLIWLCPAPYRLIMQGLSRGSGPWGRPRSSSSATC